MQPEALNCPNCGAAVSSDKTQCEFCRSRLKTVGCGSCLGLMFMGSKFCGHCGARAVAAEMVSEENAGDCPRCKIKLHTIQIGSVNVRECEKCSGFWSGIQTFESICTDQDQQSAVLSFIGEKGKEKLPQAAINYVPCPDCKELMNRSNFARSSGVIIDLCKQHGVWFDADELPKIINFINSGGMARAREKEKIAIADERSRLRDEQHKMAMMERRSGGRAYEKDDDGSLVGGIIGFLFD
jgi:Zn-finger nucleic acid-binding protein